MSRTWLLLIALSLGALVALYRSNWARSMSDLPVHLVLSGTSGFESEGRDPSKAAT
ncbi:MAG: hypothetical protein ACOC9Y_04600 [Chloroflexota bacterium]